MSIEFRGCYTWRYKFYAVCHSGLDPESSIFLDSCFRRNDAFVVINVPVYD